MKKHDLDRQTDTSYYHMLLGLCPLKHNQQLQLCIQDMGWHPRLLQNKKIHVYNARNVSIVCTASIPLSDCRAVEASECNGNNWSLVVPEAHIVTT